MKKWVKIIFVACLTLSLVAGCSKNYPDEKKLLKQVQKKMKKMESLSFSMGMDVNIVMKDKESKSTKATSKDSIKMKIDGKGDVLTSGEMYIATTMDASILGKTQESKTEVYNVLEEGQLISYTNTLGEWIKSVALPSNQIDIMTELANSSNLEMLEDAKLEIIGTKVINEKDTYDLQITIDSNMLEEIVADTVADTMEDNESLKGVPKDFSQVTDRLGDDFKMNCHFFINQDTKEIARMTMDLKSLFEKSFDSLSVLIGDSGSISVDKAEMVIDFLEYNKVKEIKLPKEALSAKDQSVGLLEDGNLDAKSDYKTEEGDVSTQTHIWENMEMTVDSNVIKVGETSVQTLVDLGYGSEESLNEKLKSDQTTYLSFSKGEERIYGTGLNRAKKKKKVKDCIIQNLNVESKQFKLAGNIGVGSTLDEAIQVFGQFNTKSTVEGFVYLEYLSADGNKTLLITSRDGVTINYIDLNNY